MGTDRGPSSAADGGAGQAWTLTATDADSFVRNQLLDVRRRVPVVAVTSWPGTSRFPLDADALARALGARARVVQIETGDATWALSEVLPHRLDVYGGAARIWWPGLSTSSDPYAHPLMFIQDRDQAARVERRIIAAVLNGDAGAGRFGPRLPNVGAPSGPAVSDAQRTFTPTHNRSLKPLAPRETILDAVVTKFRGRKVYVEAVGEIGVVAEADVPLDRLAADLPLGSVVRVRRLAEYVEGEPAFSIRGLGPDPWTRVAEVYKVGDVVRGRVSRVEPGFILVELLPGASLIAPIAELEWGFTKHPADVFRAGERVKAKILSLDPAMRRGVVSIKQAYTSAELPAVSPGPGQPLFLADGADTTPADALANPAGDDQEHRADQLQKELDSALKDRAELMKRLKSANEQASNLRRDLRAAGDRFRALEQRASGVLDPTASETAFLAAVRVEYARTFDEGDRFQYPLQRMRVGREFLERLRNLDGVSVEKVIDVCVQVASQRAHAVPAREVHQLRSSEGGAPTRVRPRDSAKAWRCSLQDNTAAARRLHWWDIPGDGGRTIEFASVAVHDDFSIPE